MKKIILLLGVLMLCASCAMPKEAENDVQTVAVWNEYEGLDGESKGWGFVRKKGAEPEIMQSEQDMFKRYDTYYIDPARTNKIYLTFDEGYENGYSAKILDILAKENVKAAFFVTGPYLREQTELVQRMIDEGHIVGNHTVNHPNLSKSDVETVREELNGLNEECKELYGVQMSYMRPPEGAYSERVLAAAKDMGYKTVLWSFAYKDWDVNSQKGSDYAFEQVTPYFHNGEIILLHAVSSDNAGALEDIIDCARKQGFEFGTLDELAPYEK